VLAQAVRVRIAPVTLLLAPLARQAQVLPVLPPQKRVLALWQGLLGLLPGMLLVLVLNLLLALSPGAVRVLAEALMVRSPMCSADSAQAQVLVQQLWAPGSSWHPPANLEQFPAPSRPCS